MTRTLLVAALAALAVVSAGCRRRGPPTLRAADDDGLARLARAAEHDLGCIEVHLMRMTDEAYVATGCGASAEYAYVCNGRRCRWDRFDPAIGSAAEALHCAEGALRVSAPTPSRRVFSGCDRTIELDLVCAAAQCRWLWATSPRSVAPPASYAAAPVDETLAIPLSVSTSAVEGDDAIAIPPR